MGRARAKDHVPTMADILFLAGTIVAFIALAALVYACERV